MIFTYVNNFFCGPYGKIRGLENEVERRTLTYSAWNNSIPKGDRRSWHPVTLHYLDATPEKMKEIKVGVGNVIVLACKKFYL